MGYWNQSRDYFQAASCSLTTTKAKAKLPKKAKNTESMNADIHLEHRAGSSQGKHEGEPSLGLCDRLDRTRDNSQRQLPTDHDYAVPTREYQTDQSSLKTAPTAARSVCGKRKKQRQQQQKQPHRFCRVDTVTPYQAETLIEQSWNISPVERHVAGRNSGFTQNHQCAQRRVPQAVCTNANAYASRRPEILCGVLA
jgi:hypothetical protein